MTRTHSCRTANKAKDWHVYEVFTQCTFNMVTEVLVCVLKLKVCSFLKLSAGHNLRSPSSGCVSSNCAGGQTTRGGDMQMNPMCTLTDEGQRFSTSTQRATAITNQSLRCKSPLKFKKFNLSTCFYHMLHHCPSRWQGPEARGEGGDGVRGGGDMLQGRGSCSQMGRRRCDQALTLAGIVLDSLEIRLLTLIPDTLSPGWDQHENFDMDR